MNPTISFELARAESIDYPEEYVEFEFIEAEFEPKAKKSLIKRAPESGTSMGKISMPLEKWLEVDQKLHQLYNFCEIAVLQRDASKELCASELKKNNGLAKETRNWKIYSEKLEKKLLDAHAELFEASLQNTRLSDAADEALNLPLFGRKKRKKELEERVLGLRQG